jgi:hypothetical protein
MDDNIIINLIIIAEIILLKTQKLIILKYILTEFPPIYKNIKKIYHRQNVIIDWDFYIIDF